MAPQDYKVINTCDNEISGWTILYRLLHARAPHAWGINGDFQYDLATLEFKNGEKLEYFHSIIIIIQQEINLSGETVSPTRPILHYMEPLSKIDKIKAFIAPNMADIIKFLYNNRKLETNIEENIHGIYHYLENIGDPTTLTTSVQHSNYFSTSF